MPGLFGQELLRHELKILGVTKTFAASEIDLDEVLEVFKLKPLSYTIHVVGRQRHAAAPREL